MKDERASFTAAFVAYARGLGDALPPDARLVDDPFGVRFGHTSRALALVPRPVFARVARTFVVYMQVRSRAFDDAVDAFVREHAAAQVVILGAGFDCRAVRLASLAREGSARVVEVDHPATQAMKRRVLDEAGARSGATYLAWDFEKRPVRELPDALRDAGLDPTTPTITLWEGVTMYLSEGAIDATVRAVHAYSAPGSALVLNYLDRRMLHRPNALQLLSKVAVQRVGEPFTWGWHPPELAAWMDARGFDVAWNKGLAQLADELLPNARARKWMREHGRYTALARRR